MIRTPAALRPLRHRDFRLLWAGLAVSLVGSVLAISSGRLPRRYLTVMILMWGLGSLPFAVVDLAGSLWVVCAALFVVVAVFSAVRSSGGRCSSAGCQRGCAGTSRA